jgi:hypothetical protein
MDRSPLFILLYLMPFIGYFLMQGLLLMDVIHKGSGYAKAGVVSLLASLTLWFLIHFAREIELDGNLHIESHLGGLGGGVGGFRISRSILHLVGAICFGVLLVLAYSPPQFSMTPPTVAQRNDEAGKDGSGKDHVETKPDPAPSAEPTK